MGSGYELPPTRTFAESFDNELSVNLDDLKYRYANPSSTIGFAGFERLEEFRGRFDDRFPSQP